MNNHKDVEIRINIKNINKFISSQCFVSSMLRFDKPIHPVVLYERYLICIFVKIHGNLNKNLKTINPVEWMW